MRGLTKAQRAGILGRLRHNHKYAVVVSYAGTFPEKEALKFASVLRVAGWTVLGPFVDENTCAEGLRIGVRDPHSPCPSAHLLVECPSFGGHECQTREGSGDSSVRLFPTDALCYSGLRGHPTFPP